MTWIDDTIAAANSSSIILNDSKTPSGRSHLGALRGILIHDALRREATTKGLDAKFLYGCDDMDALDEIPFGRDEEFRQHLGKPLHMVPPPEDLPGADMAEAYFGELMANFDVLGVEAETYRMRDVYAAGKVDESIDLFLRNRDVVARIYADVSGSQRAADWLPFQPLCENCGRIGTTVATNYDGNELDYHCSAEHQKWAQGCGYTGRRSPFGGQGKLPWKLEWAAKWKILGISIEAAGKDHMTATGSHAVSSALASEILGADVPVPLLYEFFLLGGAKMSSSKGLGVSASEMVGLMPADVLRHMVFRVSPRQAVEFTPDLQTISRSFLDYEQLRERVINKQGDADDAQLYRVSCAKHADDDDPVDFAPPFDTIASLLQLPHVDIAEHAADVKGAPLTDMERSWLKTKAATAEVWLAQFSDGAERVRLRDEAPTSLENLTHSQIAFLVGLRHQLRTCDWTAEAIQASVFDVARMSGISQRNAFEAFYGAFFDTARGPRAGSFLSFLGREKAVAHLSQLHASYRTLLDDTARTRDEVNTEMERLFAADVAVEVWVVQSSDVVAVEIKWSEKDKWHALRSIVDDHSAYAKNGEPTAFVFAELNDAEVIGE